MVNALEWSVDGVGPMKLFHNATGVATANQNYYAPDALNLSTYSNDELLRNDLIYAYSGNAYPQLWPQDINMVKWARAVMDFYNRGLPGRSDGDRWANHEDL